MELQSQCDTALWMLITFISIPLTDIMRREAAANPERYKVI